MSSISETDFYKDGFCLEYLKKGNSIQAVVKNEKDEKDVYYIGSMARHTMMQLCGYLAFIIFMLKQQKYPLVPILVLDHISKQFNEQNKKAIGLILDKVYEIIGKEDIQIFIFDDQSSSQLNIKADKDEKLIDSQKSGFVPFYNTTNNI